MVSDCSRKRTTDASALSSFEDFAFVAHGLHRRGVGKPLGRERQPMGQWVRDVRGSLSQEQFAVQLGVSRTTVADWERDHNMPELVHVLRMLQYPHTPQLPGQKLLAYATPQSVAIAALIHDLPERDRDHMVSVVAAHAAERRTTPKGGEDAAIRQLEALQTKERGGTSETAKSITSPARKASRKRHG